VITLGPKETDYNSQLIIISEETYYTIGVKELYGSRQSE
jgi:hypothetical protein